MRDPGFSGSLLKASEIRDDTNEIQAAQVEGVIHANGASINENYALIQI